MKRTNVSKGTLTLKKLHNLYKKLRKYHDPRVFISKELQEEINKFKYETNNNLRGGAK